jgi:hypothetical protein
MRGVLMWRFVAAPVEPKGLFPALAAPTGATVALVVAAAAGVVGGTTKLDISRTV